jgi:threonine/homoserine/homoserine lactone efflux protein
MEFISPLFLGFFIAAIGILPPGLINMTAAKVSMQDGRSEAISFVMGAIIIILFQTFLALFFAHFLDSNTAFINILQEIGLFLFLGLTFYFFWRGKKPKTTNHNIQKHSKTNRFFLGIMLSSLNLFPIPYYVFISITLSAYGYFFFTNTFIYTFVLGALLGSFMVFYGYILFFKKQENNNSFLLNYGNYIIGTITGLVSLVTLYNLIYK